AETQKYMNKDFDDTLYNQRNTIVSEIIVKMMFILVIRKDRDQTVTDRGPPSTE
ncbi:11780_t:CDS:1, partial [Gigaspora margarita]